MPGIIFVRDHLLSGVICCQGLSLSGIISCQGLSVVRDYLLSGIISCQGLSSFRGHSLLGIIYCMVSSESLVDMAYLMPGVIFCQELSFVWDYLLSEIIFCNFCPGDNYPYLSGTQKIVVLKFFLRPSNSSLACILSFLTYFVWLRILPKCYNHQKYSL